MKFNIKQKGQINPRDESFIRLLKSHAIMAWGISTNVLSSDPNDLYDRLKNLKEEKQARNNSDIIKEEIVAIVDKLLEYGCISKEQYNQNLTECNLLQTKKK